VYEVIRIEMVDPQTLFTPSILLLVSMNIIIKKVSFHPDTVLHEIRNTTYVTNVVIQGASEFSQVVQRSTLSW
jgi:hypothetical protein